MDIFQIIGLHLQDARKRSFEETRGIAGNFFDTIDNKYVLVQDITILF